MNTRPKLRRGRIVFAWVHDHNGFKKKRPALILTRTEDIREEQPLQVMAITTTFSDPAPNHCIELPWHPSSHPETRLTRRSAAVLGWYDEIEPDDVLGFGGDVPPRIMISLLERVDEAG